jgi:hypothetical protein
MGPRRRACAAALAQQLVATAVLLVLGVQCSTATVLPLWTVVTSPPQLVSITADLGGDAIALRSSVQAEVCQYDPIYLSVDSGPRNSSSLLDLLLVVKHTNSSAVIASPLVESQPARSLYPIDAAAALSNSSAVIKCVLNEESCVPSVGAISIRDVNVSPRSFLIDFSEDTNTPDLSDTTDVLQALDFTPLWTGA